ncbi:hypothetical protein EUBG_01380 [Escherichia coli O104:H4 str. C236-11]|nr:hypothetical protein EUBG_01380 [Escherichia coli O104:H4 str. C236-11]
MPLMTGVVLSIPTVTEGQPSPLMSAWEEYQSWDRQQNEWLQRERRRVLLQVFITVHSSVLPVIELSNGRVVAFDKNNLMQAGCCGIRAGCR